METNIEIKFKINDKEITLSEQEAKDLFFKLKEIFDSKEVYIPYTPNWYWQKWEPTWEWKPNK